MSESVIDKPIFVRARWAFMVASLLVAAHSSVAQSTQAFIGGTVTDRQSGIPIPHARIEYEGGFANVGGATEADDKGVYSLPLLPPGVYRLSASKGEDYQPRRYESVILPIAGILDVDFALRRLSDIFDHNLFRSVPTGQVLNFYGPDVDTSRAVVVEPLQIGQGRLEASISDVIDPGEIENLPFSGRDIYAALLFNAGVNADPVALRGLGLSVGGQRPSASNFLLDGLENNNYLITGPLITLAPEAVQEYRISISNFSAEYGGTSGYLANAITRGGGMGFHGIVYGNFGNDFLNASNFQENFHGYPRAPLHEAQPGFLIGDNLGSRLFLSGSFENTRLRTRQDPQIFDLPTAISTHTTEGQSLLQQYPAVAIPAGAANSVAAVSLQPPSSLDQYLGAFRLDRQDRDGKRHLFLRAAVSDYSRPDFYWTPYPAFVSGFEQRAVSTAGGYTSNLGPHRINELRASWSADHLNIGDSNHGMPGLLVANVTLPGSTSPYAYSNSGRTLQAVDNLTITAGTQIIKLGGSFLWRTTQEALRNGADGQFQFQSYADFLADSPLVYQVSIARLPPPGSPINAPDYNRDYQYGRYAGFVEDSWRFRGQLMLSVGLRYELNGAPENTGSQKDALIALGPGANLPTALAGAQWAAITQGNQALYSTDKSDWAPRFGFSWMPGRNERFLIHGSYGIFYDHAFDNLWLTVQNNAIVLGIDTLSGASIPYLKLAQVGLSSFPGLSPDGSIPQPTLFQPGLRNPRIQNAFIGFQSRLSEALDIEVNGTGSRSRGLLTNDYVNRDYSVQSFTGVGQYAPAFPVLSYVANQGFSNHDGITAQLRARTRGFRSQVSYTWSHVIDNQSDPLGGDDNLEATSVVAGASLRGRAAFVQQFNSLSTIGNADFDQRHSLVFAAITPLPTLPGHGWANRLTSRWRFAVTGAIRSGLPFTTYGNAGLTTSSPELIEDRANLLDPKTARTYVPIPGGVQILNPNDFTSPNPGQVGSSGRNAFAGPGTITSDLSISRTIVLGSHESARLVLRADAFNFLNHANLYVNFENPSVGEMNFGTAQYGSPGIPSNFPLQVPFAEAPRQIQLMARFQF